MMEPINLAELEAQKEESIDINDFVISPDKEVLKPIPILSINQNGHMIDILTEGNMSMIQGRAKSRKSTFLKVICTAILSGSMHFLRSDYSRNEIFIIDTEQSHYDSYRAVRMIKALTGKSIKYYNIAGMNFRKKMQFVEQVLEQTGNCGFFIIDNIIHFLADFNSPTESSELSDWLIKIKNKYNVHPCLVLHENGSDWGGGKAKGHIGTLLENLCETIIRVEKNKDNKFQSFVYPKEMRGYEFEKFTLETDMQGVPYISEYEEIKQFKMERL